MEDNNILVQHNHNYVEYSSIPNVRDFKVLMLEYKFYSKAKPFTDKHILLMTGGDTVLLNSAHSPKGLFILPTKNINSASVDHNGTQISGFELRAASGRCTVYHKRTQ